MHSMAEKLPPTELPETASAARVHGSEPSSRDDGPPVLVIEPTPGWRALNWREMWRYRELLYFLTWRDVKVRYKQTVLGAAWAILQPFMTMVVFTIFFGHLAGLNKAVGDIPYPIFVYSGLLAWTFFANAVTNAAGSIITSQNLITKVYFPRSFIPLASVSAGLVDFVIAFAILVLMMVWYGIHPGMGFVLLPVVTLFIVLATIGVGTLLAGLTVAYRDFRYVVPFLIQIWLYVSPVIYPTDKVASQWQTVLALNPMTGLIEGFRYCLLQRAEDWQPRNLIVSCLTTLLIFAIGMLYFRRLERRFADIV